MVIMGVDPALNHTGFAVLDEKLNLLESGVINTTGKNFEDKLDQIYKGLISVIARWQPYYFVMEDAFYHRNPRTAIKLGAVKGVCILAAKHSDVKIINIPPTVIKLSITGSGHANKEQVAFMVKKILKLDFNMSSHESDAIACVLAAVHKLRKDALFNKR